MRTKFFSRWLRTVAVVFLLLMALGTSPAEADGLLPEGIISTSIYHTCALRPNGSVDCWGSYPSAQDQPGPYTQVSVGDAYTCALTPYGAVDCWGWNGFNQADDQPGPYTQVSAGQVHTCALTPSGAVDCWGWNADNQAEDQPGPYTQVTAGHGRHTCALTTSGAIDCWGWNNNGQAEDQPGPYTQVSGGYSHTCALTPTGAVDCWGSNDYGESQDQPGPYTQVSAGYVHTCAITPTGTVDCWGDNSADESADQTGPYTQVTAGVQHTCALMSTGAVDCWGGNGNDQAEDQYGPYGPYYPGVDTTPPIVTVTGVAEGSIYTLGAVPQAGCSTTDEGSGVAVDASLSLSGGDTLGMGTFTATCSGAVDNAGNAGNTAIVSYSVAFQFSGFLAPVDNLPIINIARAGQVIPLKWRLTDANGSPVTNLTAVSVTATELPCTAGANGDLIEEYATSNSGLQNLGDGYYQWNWKTPNTYANSCKTLSLNLGEGIVHTALFQFSR